MAKTTNMFRKARIRIVAVIMGTLTAIFVLTLALIYLTSYASVSSNNLSELRDHAKGRKGRNAGMYYSVEIDDAGKASVSENRSEGKYSDEGLISLAEDVKDKSKGEIGDLLYVVEEKDGVTRITFMDNTSTRRNFSNIFRNTLLFGSLALVVLFVVAWVLSGKIVKPMEESYKLQKQFTSDAGHELKTPIAAVSANLEMLRREVGENRWLDNIAAENTRMRELVTQLLELARNENQELPKERVSFSRIVTGTILPQEAVFFEKGISVESHIADDLFVNGNKGQLEQLTTILLDNAVSHTSSGESRKTVSVVLKKVRDHVILEVTNPGKEIPEAERQVLFTRFYRADDSREYTGHYGLGLSIAKAICDAHDGKIEVTCEDGLVTFRVFLKAA